MKVRVYVTQASNDRYFGQKLPTFRNGFCIIERKLFVIPDPDDVYPVYGYIKVGKKKLVVAGNRDVEPEGWMRETPAAAALQTNNSMAGG
jgi:hypothetical protein